MLQRNRVYSLLYITLIFGCTKPGPCGKAMIKGRVMHHDLPIHESVVYIKYDAREFPGTSTGDYDASTPVDADANFEFTGLKKGNYYLFGIGFDPEISETVIGGVPVIIKDKKETVEIILAVAEE